MRRSQCMLRAIGVISRGNERGRKKKRKMQLKRKDKPGSTLKIEICDGGLLIKTRQYLHRSRHWLRQYVKYFTLVPT
jgi:hypothetical protein